MLSWLVGIPLLTNNSKGALLEEGVPEKLEPMMPSPSVMLLK
jgi:hypothetical protein